MTACYTGSFDPVTLGHTDVIRRTAKAVGRLIVAVADAPGKKTLFTAAERVGFIKDEARGLPNVEVEAFTGMLAAFLLEKQVDIIIRGVRDYNDFQYEQVMAAYNRELTGGIDTWFITPSPGLAHVSSSAVKEVAGLLAGGGADCKILSSLVPGRVAEALMARVRAV